MTSWLINFERALKRRIPTTADNDRADFDLPKDKRLLLKGSIEELSCWTFQPRKFF